MTEAKQYLLVKRGLYYRPNNSGYTALKSDAGRYPLSRACPDAGITAVHEDLADEYAPATTPDQRAIWTLRAENERLRAALATSKSPCVYCSLPAEDMAQCKSGFPGCSRADDLMGCPELGASFDNQKLREILANAIEHICTIHGPHSEDAVAAAIVTEARAALEGKE